jgi:hypothetical protein
MTLTYAKKDIVYRRTKLSDITTAFSGQPTMATSLGGYT